MLAPRLDTQGKVAAEPLTSATFFHQRACAIEITWNIRSRGTKNVGTRLPVKPDGNDARGAVGPDVRQASWNVRCEKFLRDWMFKKAEISLLDGHAVLLIWRERCRGLRPDAAKCALVDPYRQAVGNQDLPRASASASQPRRSLSAGIEER